jgi:hypothetical protein
MNHAQGTISSAHSGLGVGEEDLVSQLRGQGAG